MRIIELNASSWRSAIDFYTALLAALGAPMEHGRNINALTDSIVWGGLNEIEAPFIIRVTHIARSPKDVIDEVELAKHALAEARAQYRDQHGGDIEVQLETAG
jgi:hypothetical protein